MAGNKVELPFQPTAHWQDLGQCGRPRMRSRMTVVRHRADVEVYRSPGAPSDRQASFEWPAQVVSVPGDRGWL